MKNFIENIKNRFHTENFFEHFYKFLSSKYFYQ
jgi:hypothetical protein